MRTTPLQQQLMSRLFEALERSSLEYVVMRGYESYPLELHKPDIGMLIRPEDTRAFARLVSGECDGLGIRCRVQPQRSNIVGFHCQGRDLADALKLDVRSYEVFRFSRLMRKLPGVNYKVFVDEIETRKVSVGGITLTVPAPVDDYLLMLKHWQRKRTSVQLDKLVTLQADPAVASFLRGVPGHPQAVELPDSPAFDRMLGHLVQSRWGSLVGRRSLRRQARALLQWLRVRGLNTTEPGRSDTSRAMGRAGGP